MDDINKKTDPSLTGNNDLTQPDNNTPTEPILPTGLPAMEQEMPQMTGITNIETPSESIPPVTNTSLETLVTPETPLTDSLTPNDETGTQPPLETPPANADLNLTSQTADNTDLEQDEPADGSQNAPLPVKKSKFGGIMMAVGALLLVTGIAVASYFTAGVLEQRVAVAPNAGEDSLAADACNNKCQANKCEKCVNGTCKVDKSNCCTSNNDCKSTERCRNKKCEPKYECDGDTPCPAGKKCINGACVDSNADRCDKNSDCGSLNCGGACGGAADCRAESICAAGVCKCVAKYHCVGQVDDCKVDEWVALTGTMGCAQYIATKCGGSTGMCSNWADRGCGGTAAQIVCKKTEMLSTRCCAGLQTNTNAQCTFNGGGNEFLDVRCEQKESCQGGGTGGGCNSVDTSIDPLVVAKEVNSMTFKKAGKVKILSSITLTGAQLILKPNGFTGDTVTLPLTPEMSFTVDQANRKYDVILMESACEAYGWRKLKSGTICGAHASQYGADTDYGTFIAASKTKIDVDEANILNSPIQCWADSLKKDLTQDYDFNDWMLVWGYEKSTAPACTEAAVYVSRNDVWTKIARADVAKTVKFGETIRLGAKVSTANVSYLRFFVHVNKKELAGAYDVPADGTMLTDVHYKEIKISETGDYRFEAAVK